MKLAGKNNHGKENSGTLASQIEETERQLVVRQRFAHFHVNTFIKDLRREMASPTTLLLASEFGFILGELTKRPSPHAGPAVKKDADGSSAPHEEISPLKEALNIGSLVTTLYQALPLALIMDTFHPQDAPQAGSAAAVKNTKAKVDLTKK